MERNSLGAMTASGTVRTSPVTTARLDQLSVQCEMERRAIRAEFENAQRAAAEWEPTNEL